MLIFGEECEKAAVKFSKSIECRTEEEEEPPPELTDFQRRFLIFYTFKDPTPPRYLKTVQCDGMTIGCVMRWIMEVTELKFELDNFKIDGEVLN